MAGRPPKPTALKLLTGNPGKRPLPDREPKPSVGRPRRPPWLSKPARRFWRPHAELLESMGVLTVADGTALAMLCEALADWQAVEKQADRADAWKRANTMLQQFGLTPASRAKVKVELPQEDDELEALLRRKTKH